MHCEYRHRLSRKRRELVRTRLEELIAEADAALTVAMKSSGVTSRDHDRRDAAPADLDVRARGRLGPVMRSRSRGGDQLRARGRLARGPVARSRSRGEASCARGRLERVCTLVRAEYRGGPDRSPIVPVASGDRRSGTGHAPGLDMNARSDWPCLGPAWRSRRAR